MKQTDWGAELGVSAGAQFALLAIAASAAFLPHTPAPTPQQSPILFATITFLISTDWPLMLALVLMVPDMVVSVNETLPLAVIPKDPPHVMAKLNVFPE